MHEYMYNKTFVASATRKELDDLAAFRNERKEDWEEMWNKVYTIHMLIYTVTYIKENHPFTNKS